MVLHPCNIAGDFGRNSSRQRVRFHNGLESGRNVMLLESAAFILSEPPEPGTPQRPDMLKQPLHRATGRDFLLHGIAPLHK